MHATQPLATGGVREGRVGHWPRVSVNAAGGQVAYPANPVTKDNTIIIYCTGPGTITPVVPAGAPPPERSCIQHG